VSGVKFKSNTIFIKPIGLFVEPVRNLISKHNKVGKSKKVKPYEQLDWKYIHVINKEGKPITISAQNYLKLLKHGLNNHMLDLHNFVLTGISFKDTVPKTFKYNCNEKSKTELKAIQEIIDKYLPHKSK
jgi:hypothetical protein